MQQFPNLTEELRRPHRFQEHFVAANAIPHATAAFPNLATEVSLPDVAFNTGDGEGGGRRRRRRA